MMRAILMSLATLLVAGCATTPKLPPIQTKQGDRVGVLVDMGDSPSHTHIGTTVFNNFEKTYAYQWGLRARVSAAIKSALSNAGFSVVDLKAEGLNYADLDGLIVIDSGSWKISPAKEAVGQRLSDQLGVKAVVALKEEPVMTAMECFGGPCSFRYANASGLYTRSVLSTRYWAVAAFKWNVIVLSPPADIAQVERLSKKLHMPVTLLKDFPEPADFHNLTEAEFAPVEDAIGHFVAVAAMDAAKTLNPR